MEFGNAWRATPPSMASCGIQWVFGYGEGLGLAELQVADKEIEQLSLILDAALFKHLRNTGSWVTEAPSS